MEDRRRASERYRERQKAKNAAKQDREKTFKERFGILCTILGNVCKSDTQMEILRQVSTYGPAFPKA